ncbi:hypothetical protein EDD53_1982 [Pacificibacter maritimus]|uniref:Uncharacterized protein n=1 Tax=Pacificibacter maritimus TaxID=762213 RepID=A0A3N4U755_9RHOB|nr:hypothetical protein [Pacificibacter maritimus]RPE66282.1 hypothetical protein EDD53_1982 [Pacificibacter maritimus]
MIRPEVRAQIWHFREVIGAVALAFLFVWFFISSYGFMRWVALALICASLFIAFAAFQRARFAKAGQGVGVVEVDEGVVSYFTAFTGGQVEIDTLTSVILLPATKGSAHWQLEAAGQTTLNIPLDAVDAEKLFDVFVSLDGIETERMLKQIKQMPKSPVVVWRKRTLALH